MKQRTSSRPERLEHLVRKLLIIVGRIARLLEIMHFDPEDFSSTIADNSLDKPTKLMFMTSSHMPYILNRLSTSLAPQDDEEEEGEWAECALTPVAIGLTITPRFLFTFSPLFTFYLRSAVWGMAAG